MQLKLYNKPWQMQVIIQKAASLGKIKYNTLIINGAPFLADYIPNLGSYR